jgi:hypothetical protein
MKEGEEERRTLSSGKESGTRSTIFSFVIGSMSPSARPQAKVWSSSLWRTSISISALRLEGEEKRRKTTRNSRSNERQILAALPLRQRMKVYEFSSDGVKDVLVEEGQFGAAEVVEVRSGDGELAFEADELDDLRWHERMGEGESGKGK